MGYRSDFTLLIYGPEKHVDAFVAAHAMAGRSLSQFFDDDSFYETEIDVCDTDDGPEKTISISCEGIKYYTTYPEVATIDAIAADADGFADRFNVSIEFARIGDEADDTTLMQHGNDCAYRVYVSRAIRVDAN